jgi:hypothetical protein
MSYMKSRRKTVLVRGTKYKLGKKKPLPRLKSGLESPSLELELLSAAFSSAKEFESSKALAIQEMKTEV